MIQVVGVRKGCGQEEWNTDGVDLKVTLISRDSLGSRWSADGKCFAVCNLGVLVVFADSSESQSCVTLRVASTASVSRWQSVIISMSNLLLHMISKLISQCAFSH